MKVLLVLLLFSFSLNSEGTKFVSLGSNCGIAHLLRDCEIRHEAYPFDWIVSMDIEALNAMLYDDFKYFLDKDHLVVHGVIGDVPLLNTTYHLEFLHEGNWKRREFAATMENFQDKYSRRIERFRSLRDYPGKVYFLRQAYPGSLSDPHRVYKFEANLDISQEHALELYQALNDYFPNLDFELIIVNFGEAEGIEKEYLKDNLMMARVSQTLDDLERLDAFKAFFRQLY